VFTRGEKLEIDKEGASKTGNWKVNLAKLEKVDKVIIYLREAVQSGGKILMGNYVGFEPSPEEGRYIILFSNLKEIGSTASNWREFSHMWQTPVAFVDEF